MLTRLASGCLAGRSTISKVLVRCYAPPKAAATTSAVNLPAGKAEKAFVEEDVEKLCKHVCINHYVQGEEPGPKILPDSEYPSWLFELDLRPPRSLEELDPEKDGWLYWRALKHRQDQQFRRYQKLRYRWIHLQDSPSLKKLHRKQE
ncbi:hypothetical protein WR25_05928 [Diploscapter pachys]|uniref:Large ribosomal subunit protein mL54 n=1 Tax=Diploscapter pachys TaxID=2018661 RepID=A0A2A2J2C1_9BILA|nr:hypothetical protein WR25_05928 [Diploscapter pachys]